MSPDNPIHALHPAGTSVRLPDGRTGVILEAPDRHDGPYRVEHADGTRGRYTHHELASRRRAMSEVIAERGRDDTFYRDRVAYECVIGSVAYGLDREDSDVDVRGFFVAPEEQWLGLPELQPPGQIEGERDPETHRPLPGEDWVYWEAGKFVRQLLSANPTYLETLFTPIVLRSSPVGDRLRAMRRAFLSRELGRTYSGYAISQLRKMEKAVDGGEGDPTAYRAKHAMHLFRLLHAGEHALRTGDLMVEVPERLRDELLSLVDDPPPIDALAERARTFIAERFDPAMEATDLPDHPDVEAADRFLRWARTRPPRALVTDPRQPRPEPGRSR